MNAIGNLLSILCIAYLALPSITTGLTLHRSNARDVMLYHKLRRTVATAPKQKRDTTSRALELDPDLAMNWLKSAMAGAGEGLLAEKPPGSLKLTERPPADINAASGESVIIECEFWGWPTPSSIFWLKDDMPVVQNGQPTEHANKALKRMTHASLEPEESNMVTSKVSAETGTELGTVRARLYLPCVSTQDAGLYTCIAESPLGKKAAAKTILHVPDVNELPSQECDQKALELPPAVLLSRGVLGQGQGTSAILLCRTAGGVVTWAGPNSEPLNSSKKYHVRSNGDLVIENLNFDDMGEYTCRVENDAGFDEVTTFVYPFSPE